MPSLRNTNNSHAATVSFVDTATRSTVYVPPSPSSSSKRQKEDYVKRPMNAFMLFRSYAYNNGLVSDDHQNNISEMVAKMWRAMPENEKQVWRQRAAQVKEEHKKRYPGYRFIPGQKISERSAMAPTLKVAEEKGKTSTMASQPMSINPPAKQPEIPFFVVLSRGSIHSETTQPRFDDYDTLSDDSSIDGVASPVTLTTGYDPYQPYQSVDHHMISYDEIAERNAKVFSNMRVSMYDINDTPMDKEDVNDEEIEKLMKQFIVDL